MNPQLQKMVQQAIQAFQGGNFDSASLILRRVLQADSKNLPALHILGLIKASRAKYQEAVDFLGRAARISPNDASIQYNLAKALTDSGNDKDAITHHKKAVTLAPNNPEAWLSYGKTASNLGRYEDALIWYGNALALNPDYAEALFNRAATLKELKHFDEAISCYDKALSLKANHAEGWFNKGVTLCELEDFEEAIVCYDKALILKPDCPEGWVNKGVALHELKHFEGAIVCYDKALSLKPDYPDGWSNKGITLNNLKHFEEAIACYDKALNLRPEHAESWSNKGASLCELKDFEEAIACYDKALSLNPDIEWIFGDLVHAKMKMCSWSDLADSLEIVSKKVIENEKISQPFSLLALHDDALLHKKTSEVYIQSKYPSNNALGPFLKRSGNQKIRVGYFSADFHNHATGYLMAELFELHDKSSFELIAFSFGPISTDDMRQRLEKSFDQFIEVGSKLDIEIAQLSRDLNIDIAVDLKGFTQDSRTGIFSYRAAPIQVNYLGYPGTMGANYIDYIVADQTLIPLDAQSGYSEKVVYLPNSYQVNDRKRVISDKQFTRQELGLPEKEFVFCCFNNNFKILPVTFASWMRILKRVEGSVLWLFQDNPRVVDNLKREALNYEVEASRLIFAERMPLSEHLARHRQADLFLDTFPCNAHTTTSDALWTGLPLITLAGCSFASRVAASLLNAIDLPELIASNQDEYEALAIELALNPKMLADTKLKLTNNCLTAPLYDTPLFTKHLEAAYIKMMERYQADVQADHISIN